MCTRPSVVARSRASRDRFARRRRRARSLDDAARSLARAARRLADAPSDSRASDSRAWRGGVESKRRARLARDSRDARAIRDSRFATDRRVVARASTFASRSRSRVAVRGVARVEARVAVAPTDRDRPTACSYCLRIRNGRPASRHRTVCPHAMAPCAKRRHPTPPRRARGDGSRRRRRRRRCSRSARRRSRPAARRWRRERARARREDAPDDARRRARGFRSTSSTAKSETTCLG